jgi:hypothetical protein
VTGLLNPDVKKRLGTKNGFQEIAKHPWMSNLDVNKIIQKKVKSPFIPEFMESNMLQNFDKKLEKEAVSSIMPMQ